MSQAQGLQVCLSLLEDHQQAGIGMKEVLCSHVLQAVNNAAEYGPCRVALQRSPQLEVIRRLAEQHGQPLVVAAATQALRIAGVPGGSSVDQTA